MWHWKIIWICRFQVYFEPIKNLVMKYTSSILEAYFEYISRILQIYCNLLKTSTLYFNFLKCIFISFVGKKYTSSRLLNPTNLHSKLEVYLKYNLWIDAFFQTQKYTWSGLFYDFLHVFIFKLQSILLVDFLNRWIYFENQKYTWNGLSVSIDVFFWSSEV